MPDRLLEVWSSRGRLEAKALRLFKCLGREVAGHLRAFQRADATNATEDSFRDELEYILNRLRRCEVTAMQLAAQGDEPLQLVRVKAEIARLKEFHQKTSGEALTL